MKKITPQQYAEAFIGSLADKKVSQAKAIDNFLTLIRRNGGWRKCKEIIEACVDAMRKREGKNLVEIRSARPLEKTQRTKIEAMFKNADFEEHVDPELIAGVKIMVDRERQFDGTLKHKLDTILEHV